MTAVAADITSDVPTLKLHHLEYLYDQAQFVPAYAPGTRTTIEDSKFAQRDGYAKLIQDTKIKLAQNVEQARLADQRLFQQEVNQLKKISKQLKGSAKMHAGQAKKLDKIAGKYMNK